MSVAADIAALPEATRPRFVLVAGDLVNTAGDAEQRRRFQEARARFTVPVWVVPGNHDLTRDGRTLAPDLVDGSFSETYRGVPGPLPEPEQR